MTLEEYVRGIFDLEIVTELYVMRKAENREIYLVSATRLDDNSDFAQKSEILNKEFTYSYEDFCDIIADFVKDSHIYTIPVFYDDLGPDCPYLLEGWSFSKV